MPVVDQTDMLRYDYEVAGSSYQVENKRVLLKSTDPKGNVRLPDGWELEMVVVRELLATNGVKWEDEDGGEGCSCRECSAPGSTVEVVLEAKRDGKMRLRVTSSAMCCCNIEGPPIEAYADDYLYYPILEQSAANGKRKTTDELPESHRQRRQAELDITFEHIATAVHPPSTLGTRAHSTLPITKVGASLERAEATLECQEQTFGNSICATDVTQQLDYSLGYHVPAARPRGPIPDPPSHCRAITARHRRPTTPVKKLV
eukprot:8588222-Pyramimonas_sp.AAC.1